jgi:menaquinone-9 beta-reductase
LAIASIPYGYVQNRSIGLWCIGDQAAVIPSFSGDGIAIALHSARWTPNAIWQAKRVPNFKLAWRATLLVRFDWRP